MTDGVDQGFHVSMTRCFDTLEFHVTALLCDDSFEKQHMKMDIEI